MGIKEDFIKKTKMIDINNEKEGVKDVMDYLLNPKIIFKMLIASEMELPVLTLIAKDLENRFDENSNFPMVVTNTSKNATARQNVGRMIKFIMEQYGYTPIEGGLSERSRIPAISGAEYFATSAIYKKTDEAKYEIKIDVKKII